MARVTRQREIIDRRALTQALTDLAHWSGYSERNRGEVLAQLRLHMEQGEETIRRRFEAGEANGRVSAQSRSFLFDQMVRVIYDFAVAYAYPTPNPTAAEQISILATGGYGRGLLAPKSDLDLLFLMPYRATGRVEQIVEFILYTLWDLGLKVGHATRTIDQCLRLAKEDHTIRTAMLDSRWIWGDQDLFTQFHARYRSEVIAGTGAEYVEEKLAERDARHERMGDSRYVLEPNVKEGKGAQRDLQTMYWLTKYLFDVDRAQDLVGLGILTKGDVRRFVRAHVFLWTVRFHLHYLAGRAEERLTFDVQTEIATRMGYADRAGASGVERFMRHYFLVAKDIGNLTRLVCANLEHQHKKRRKFPFRLTRANRKYEVPGLRIETDRLTFQDDQVPASDPVMLLRLFREAQRTDLDLHPEALRMVNGALGRIDGALRRDPGANSIFVDILTAREGPETTLRQMNEAGVLGRFIRDFNRVVAQMQYDMYHVYTVDEHSIRAVGILHGLEKGLYAEEMPISHHIMQEVISRRALYLAVFLHDIGKGRGEDHSVVGARIAQRLCPRLGLSDEETETVAWLVRHHLLMSRIAFKRDLANAKTITDFVDEVQSPERLKLLLVLTAVDIRAVGPGVWNGWKARLLRELYHLALGRMTGQFVPELRDIRVEKAKQAVRDALPDWQTETLDEILELAPPEYWLTQDTDDHVRHTHLLVEARKSQDRVHLGVRTDPDHDVTEITVYTIDHPGLFSRIAGALALAGASIVRAKVVTLLDGMALDSFLVQDTNGRAYDINQPGRKDRITALIEDVQRGEVNIRRQLATARSKAMPSRMRVFSVAPRVLIDNKASRTHSVIEINGRDRLGFLHDVTAALTRLGLQISSANVATWGERAVDVFYVKDVFGLKIESEDKLRKVRETLLEAITPEEATQDSTAMSA